jgi:hypothetical protein
VNQIAVGDSSNTIVLEGQSVSAPFYHAIPSFVGSSDPYVSEKVDVLLKGTPEQISTGLADLEKIITRAELYARKAYPSPQYLRFQLASGGPYYYAEVSNLYLTCPPEGYKTHSRGSIVAELHYLRPNYFDGPQVEVFLNGRFGENLAGGVPLYNHTDYHIPHGSSVYIKPGSLTSPMPAPLRVELENTTATGALKDIYIGVYHHLSNDHEDPFFHNAPDIYGGTLLMNVNAINDYYRRLTWSAVDWTSIASITLTLDTVDLLAGETYRPMVHLFNSHAYSDLYLGFKLQRGLAVIYASEPVYADPDYDYVFLPPVDLPPNQLLRETLPHSLDFVLYAYKASGGTYTLDIDQVQLFPLAYSASFSGFFTMSKDDKLIDDSFRGLSNVRYSASGSETVAHIRLGGPLCVRSGAYNRLFFVMADGSNTVDLMRTATLRIYQRERRRIL